MGCDIEAGDLNNLRPLDIARGNKNLVELFENALKAKNNNADLERGRVQNNF